MKTEKGIFIVIDGTDGSGKKTQTELLVNRLKEEHIPVKPVSFPNYGKPAAALIELYLNGAFGTDERAVDPYVVSTFYAADRFAEKHSIQQALDNGEVVVADRYVTANMAHQGGKFHSDEERTAYFKWLYDFEYEKGKIPKPDLNIILYVPAEINIALIENRGNKKDIHENNPEHLKRADQTYREIAKLFPDIQLIECCENGAILPREKIHELIWKRVKPLLKNPT